jgi:uncharacterized damage-inducible protein DinB
VAEEPWLRGPLSGVDPTLMPAAHALMQSAEDIETAVTGLTASQLWVKPGGAASVGFHVRHVAGSIDRLLTYAAGGQLSEAQRARLSAETRLEETPPTGRELVMAAQAAIDVALDVIRRTPVSSLFEPREVGRGKLPSNVIGLLFHIAEHTQRHTGQIVATAKIVRGLGLGSG